MSKLIHRAVQHRHVHIEAPEAGPVCENDEVEESPFQPLNESCSYHSIVLAHLEVKERLIGRVFQIAHLHLTPHVEEVLGENCGICNEEKVINKV